MVWKDATSHFRLPKDDDILVPCLEVVKRTRILPLILRLKVTHYIQLRLFQVITSGLAVVVDANCVFADVLVFTSRRKVRKMLEKDDGFV